MHCQPLQTTRRPRTCNGGGHAHPHSVDRAGFLGIFWRAIAAGIVIAASAGAALLAVLIVVMGVVYLFSPKDQPTAVAQASAPVSAPASASAPDPFTMAGAAPPGWAPGMPTSTTHENRETTMSGEEWARRVYAAEHPRPRCTAPSWVHTGADALRYYSENHCQEPTP